MWHTGHMGRTQIMTAVVNNALWFLGHSHSAVLAPAEMPPALGGLPWLFSG